MRSLQKRLSNRNLHSLDRVVFVVLEGDSNTAKAQDSAFLQSPIGVEVGHQTHVSADFEAEEEVCSKVWTEVVGRISAAAAATLNFDARLSPSAALSMERRKW